MYKCAWLGVCVSVSVCSCVCVCVFVYELEKAQLNFHFYACTNMYTCKMKADDTHLGTHTHTELPDARN